MNACVHIVRAMRDLKRSAIPQFEYSTKWDALLKELSWRYPEAMLVLIQSILVAVTGFFIAFLGVFGLNLDVATAPSERPPAIITEPHIATTTAETRVPETTVTAEPDNNNVTEIPTKQPTPASPVTKEPAPITPPAASVPVTTPINPSLVNETVRKSVVNIFCTSLLSGPFDSVSASGVLIDSRGVILTNAHVAQYYLLRDYPTPGTLKCVIRTGAPAVAMYTSELLFLPPSWMKNNAEKIHDENPLGTGQHDYALVRITGVINPNDSLPTSFPALPISTVFPKLDDDILVVGYPAGFLDGISLQRGLYQTSAFTKVRELLTFVESTLDLFSIGGSVVAQSGASGGAATNTQGELMGVVVTSTQAPDTASRDLRAITTSYLFRDFQSESGESLLSYLSGDLAEKTKTFRETKEPALIEALTAAIESTQTP